MIFSKKNILSGITRQILVVSFILQTSCNNQLNQLLGSWTVDYFEGTEQQLPEYFITNSLVFYSDDSCILPAIYFDCEDCSWDLLEKCDTVLIIEIESECGFLNGVYNAKINVEKKNGLKNLTMTMKRNDGFKLQCTKLFDKHSSN